MQAAVLKEDGRMALRQVETPECPPDGVLLRVDACAVCGTDVKALRHGHRIVKPPVILGHELAGTIVEVGSAVSGYYDSERVAVAPAVPCGSCRYCRSGRSTVCENIINIGSDCDGGFAEFMVVPPRAVRQGSLNKVPNRVSSAAAALTEPLACCLNAQERMEVGPADEVLIMGCGPIGCLHAMLARTLGARKVYMTDLRADRLKLAEVAAADAYVDAEREELTERVGGLTDGRGVQVLIVACASPEAQRDSVELVAPRGRISFFGGLPQGTPEIEFDSNRVHYEEIAVFGTHGSNPYHNYKALSLIGSGRVGAEALVTHRFSLSRVEEAIGVAESKEALKVLVEPHD